MNREDTINAIVKAYMDSIMSNDIEAWVENILRCGRDAKGFEDMTDEELSEYYGFWVDCREEEA